MLACCVSGKTLKKCGNVLERTGLSVFSRHANKEPSPRDVGWSSVNPAGNGPFHSSLRARFLNHVFNLMSRRSKKKTGLGKTPSVRAGAFVRPADETWGGTSASPPAAGSSPADLPDRWLVPGVCVFLAAIVWLVFGQTLGFGFVNFDDDKYVYQNPIVQKGLTLPGVVWAFTHVYASNWHPLTWLSLMLDCQCYGLNAGGHHLTNILVHTATVILLFLVLRRMTGFLWRSAFVAAVFAIHPLRVESVAWVAERKDVLSGLFFMLTIGAYVRYAQRPWSAARYGLVALLFALGLLCKPMLVTLPLVLLLLDYWPLNRLRADAGSESFFQLAGRRIPRRLIFEKLPLLGLTVASCLITIFAQTRTIQTFENFSLPLRLGNALISCVAYMGQMFWPSGLAVLYPFTAGGVRVSAVALSVVVLAGISTGVVVLRRRPYFLTGWLWYLIMLVPVIGILQVGWQARADRYTYLPQIGLYVLLTWAVADLCAGWRHRRVLLGGSATIILIALIFCAHAQTAHWRNSESLWTHTLACTSDNFIGRDDLGNALFQKGKVEEAIADFQRALQINSDFAEAHDNLGNALFQKGKMDEAIAHFQRALQINPDFADAHNGLGNALLRQGKVDEAIGQYQNALQINPDFVVAHYNLGSALFQKGDVDGAMVHFQKALQINPNDPGAHNNFGNVLFESGNVDQAVAQYQRALRINPDFADAHNGLGNALLQQGQVAEAVAQYQTALQINPGFAEARNGLGNALLQQGKAEEAIANYQTALQINPGFAEAHNNLGAALLHQGRVDEAIADFQRALQINPDYAEACYNLGNAFRQKGSLDEAIANYQKALRIKPNYAEACYNLGNVFRQKGSLDEAIAYYQKALQIKPGFMEAQNNLAWLLATCPQASLRNGYQALALALRANQLTGGGNPVVLGTLAAAYAEVGSFPEAVATAQRALQLAESRSDTALADAIRSQLKLYQTDRPFHLP
jgi:protein O-mannosyl-transferase